MSGAGQAAVAASGDQFYVTHCVTTDSVLNSPGYSVRATSAPGDGDRLRLALEYPPYELPIELWRDKPGKAQSPRRLTRTKHPGGGVWVVHSVYLEKDTMNRDRSYFSHLMHLPASVDPAAVLRSWDAEGWRKEYPQKADKNLPRGRLPVGTAISDEALTAFLSGSQTGPADLAVAVCPVRLRANPAARRELVGRFLQGVILATQDDDRRDRLFVHAEPGLVAMLLYAAARVLPPAWMADLTFSTFEPSHRGLRDYELATVIGTYLGPAAKGLDPELTSSRGYGLDTLHPERSSAELSGPLPVGLEELIGIVAAGEWELLADVHRLIGSEEDALGRVSKMVPIARAVTRLNQGEPTIEDLLTLQGDSRGAAALTQRAEKVWPHVRAGALTDPRIRAEFKGWLAEPTRLDEFRREGAKALMKGDLAGWDTRWAVVREAADAEQIKVQVEKALKNLDEHLPALPAHARIRLRAACAEASVWPDHHLLAPTSQEELGALLAPGSPAEWQGYACFAVMGPDAKNWLLPATLPFRPAMRERVRRHLLMAPAAVLGGYLRHAGTYVSSDPTFLYDLLRPHTTGSVAFLDRLIDGAASVIDAADWVKLLSDLNVYNAPEWSGFLFANDHLAKLLAGFGNDPAATQVWKNYLDLISPVLFEEHKSELFEEHKWEVMVYDQLSKAKQSLGAAGIPLKSVLPEGGPAKMNAIDVILGVMNDPGTAAGLPDGVLLRAFQAFWPENPENPYDPDGPIAGLRKIYFHGNFDKLDLPGKGKQLEPFIAAFLACYPITTQYSTARAAVTWWLVISENCPEETRAAFQVYFVTNYVNGDWHRDILDERRRFPFLPDAEARIREALAATVRKTGGQYARPGSPKSSGDDEEAYVSAATRRARKAKSRGGAGPRRRGSGGGGGRLAVIVVGMIVVVLLIVAVAVKLKSSKTPEPEPEPPPVKTKPAPKK